MSERRLLCPKSGPGPDAVRPSRRRFAPPQDEGEVLLPQTSFPHPEERPQGARLEGRTAPVLAVVSRLLILFVVVLVLAGCGKKGTPQPPPNEPNTFPRTYPSA